MSDYIERRDAVVYCAATCTRVAIERGELRAWAIRDDSDRRLWNCGWSTLPGQTAGCTAVMDDFGNLRAVS